MSVIVFAIVYLSALPAALAIVGWLLSGDRRKIATILVACLGIWPIYHVLAQDPVGTNKHLVFGYLFAYPLVGVTLAKLWGARRSTFLHRLAALTITTALAAVGFVQIRQADQAFPNLTWPANFLAARVAPGDALLINESWPITMVLYTRGRIHTPWDVYDTYRVLTEPTAPGICDYDWVVDVRGSYRWPTEIQEALEACTGYTRVYSHATTIVNPGTDFAYISYPVETVIWQATTQRPVQANDPAFAQAMPEER